jgi:hypothetical protein
MRRNVVAEFGGDYRKLWAWYVEQDRQAAEQEAESQEAGKQSRPAA